jgi:hypothetical protein
MAAAAHGGDDLVDADAEARADGGARIRLIGARPAGDEGEALAQIAVLGSQLRDRPVPGDSDRLPGQKEGGEKTPAVKEGEPRFSGLPVDITERLDAVGNGQGLAAPVGPIRRRLVEGEFDAPSAVRFC